MLAKPHIRLRAEEGLRPQLSGNAYDGASLRARDLASWVPPRRSADAEILPNWGALVGRSRDLDRNNPIARSVRQTSVDNVVGIGPMLMSDPDWKTLGYDEKWAAEFAERLERRFHAWWWSWSCHAGDCLTGGQLTQLAKAAMIMNGDAIGLPLWLPEYGDGYATKLQLVEADVLGNPDGRADSRYLRGGIKLNDYGMPLGYWFRKGYQHPGDGPIGGFDLSGWEYVPRRTDFGRLRVIHLYDPERSPQSRGKPLLTTIIPELKNVDRYKRAEIEAAVRNAYVAGIITTPLGAEDIMSLWGDNRSEYLDLRTKHAVGLESGSLLSLFPGDDFKSHNPTRPAAQFGNFIENCIRIAACGADLPYELLVKDFSKTTYTSGRMSLLEAWRSFNRQRDILSTGWLDPILGLLAEEEVDAGRIEADGFEEPSRRRAFLRCQWIFPGRGWVDQVKEAEGVGLRMQSYVTTLAKECAEQGLYWRDVLRQHKIERDFMVSLGLPLPETLRLRPSASQAATDSEDSAPRPDGGSGTQTSVTAAA